jgi:hypothetical protein
MFFNIWVEEYESRSRLKKKEDEKYNKIEKLHNFYIYFTILYKYVGGPPKITTD